MTNSSSLYYPISVAAEQLIELYQKSFGAAFLWELKLVQLYRMYLDSSSSLEKKTFLGSAEKDRYRKFNNFWNLFYYLLKTNFLIFLVHFYNSLYVSPTSVFLYILYIVNYSTCNPSQLFKFIATVVANANELCWSSLMRHYVSLYNFYLGFFFETIQCSSSFLPKRSSFIRNISI